MDCNESMWMWRFLQGELTKNKSKRESDRQNEWAKLVYTRDIFLVVSLLSENAKWPMKLQGRKKIVGSE